MGNYNGTPSFHTGDRVTLETLKEELYSLNMRLRLAMQIHDDTTQRALEQQIGELDRQINAMKDGRYGV
jgi:hypothetical protein